MLSLFSLFALTPVNPAPIADRVPQEQILQQPPLPLFAQSVIVDPQEIRSLPGQLDEIPVFNSNSPEVVYGPGILLSTFPPEGMSDPRAHLNYPLEGRFDIFTHHIARGRTPSDWRPLYQGVMAYNPSDRPVRIEITQGLSYVTNPDAPFIDLPPLVENSTGKVFSGPGSRLTNDILRGLHQPIFPTQIEIAPKSIQMLFSLPIRLGNARSTWMRLKSNGPVHLANLAIPARILEPEDKSGGDSLPENLDKAFEDSFIPPNPVPHRPPTIEEWRQILVGGRLATPRDLPPTAPDADVEKTIYGRVAGIAQGTQWQTVVADGSNTRSLRIPEPGGAFSYPLSTVSNGTLGTGQVQSAPMLVRYPDTAYRAHGNYGIRYYLTLPLLNDSDRPQTVTLSVQTPLKQDENDEELRFLDPPDDRIFFRGTVQVRYTDDRGLRRTRSFHLVQRRGQQGQPLVTLQLPPRDRREVKIDFLYPPDATPPQVLTVRTAEEE